MTISTAIAIKEAIVGTNITGVDGERFAFGTPKAIVFLVIGERNRAVWVMIA